MTRSAAARSRRLARFRATALPTLRLAVKPTRRSAHKPSPSSVLPSRTCKIRPGAAHLRRPPATRRNSDRRLRRPTSASIDLTPRGVYASWPGGVRESCDRRPWTYGRGSRAAACAQARSVDRCASLNRTPLPSPGAGAEHRARCIRTKALGVNHPRLPPEARTLVTGFGFPASAKQRPLPHPPTPECGFARGCAPIPALGRWLSI